jgi:hypothetical protein
MLLVLQWFIKATKQWLVPHPTRYRFTLGTRKYYKWINGKAKYFGKAGCNFAEAWAAYERFTNRVKEFTETGITVVDLSSIDDDPATFFKNTIQHIEATPGLNTHERYSRLLKLASMMVTHITAPKPKCDKPHAACMELSERVPFDSEIRMVPKKAPHTRAVSAPGHATLRLSWFSEEQC